MVLRRIGAYIIDFLIILLLSTFLNQVMPNQAKVDEISTNNLEILSEAMKLDYAKEEDKFDTLMDEANDNSYKLSKLTVYSSLSTIVLYFLYFIVLQRYNNGQTLGKTLLKIEVCSDDDKEISFKQLLIRGIVLYPILFDLLSIISIFIFNRGIYENISFWLFLIHYGLFIACALSLLSGRALHDRIAKTTVKDVRSSDSIEESNVTKWQKNTNREKDIKKYRENHTSGKRKGGKNE